MFCHSSVSTILNILYSEVDKSSTILAKNNFTPGQIQFIHEFKMTILMIFRFYVPWISNKFPVDKHRFPQS